MMPQARFALIFTGHGELEALPILLRRIAGEIDPGLNVHIVRRIRAQEDRLRKPGELERCVSLAGNHLGGDGAVLVVMDADWPEACPAKDGPDFLKRAQAERSDVPIAVVLAKCEFEAWFLAAAESIAGVGGLSDALIPPDDPESIRGAKEWLSQHMPSSKCYKEVIDQPAMAAKFDMVAAAQASPSFAKFRRDAERLLRTIAS